MAVLDCWYKEVCTKEPCTSGCVRYTEMSYLMQASGIPKNKQTTLPLYPEDIDYDAFTQLNDIKSDILQFVQKGENLYITSENTGNGKTTWAIKIMLKYFDEVWAGNGLKPRGVFVHVPAFLTKLKNFSTKDEEFDVFKHRLLDVDLVIWDDIACAGLSNYDLMQLIVSLDYRILEGKSNIYTGNITTKDQLEKVMGSRLASRIFEADVIKLSGKDRR